MYSVSRRLARITPAFKNMYSPKTSSSQEEEQTIPSIKDKTKENINSVLVALCISGSIAGVTYTLLPLEVAGPTLLSIGIGLCCVGKNVEIKQRDKIIEKRFKNMEKLLSEIKNVLK